MKTSGAVRSVVALCAALSLILGGWATPLEAQPTYEVFAIRYATLPQFAVSGLVAGADPSRRLDIAMMVWLLKGSNGRMVLVDAGFKPREDLMARWRPLEYQRPSDAVGDAREIIPGISVYTGGKHTFQSQYASVRIAGGVAVIASDNAYLFENLESHKAISQTLDPASNLAAQERMLKLASSPRLVVPGHDPLVFSRFESVAPGVVRIR